MSPAACWTDPVRMIGLGALAFAVFFALLGVTTLMFRRIGRERALALGLMVSQRNMGLMLAATDGVLPATTWLYFALCAVPDLPVAATAEADRRSDARATRRTRRARCCRCLTRVDRRDNRRTRDRIAACGYA